jgi:HPt (histidine-containing phosphotransfer) domain-containing protein
MPNAETSIFDRADLMDRMMGDCELACTIIEAFLADTPQQLDALEKHLQERDITAAHRRAHGIKGAAAAVGANVLRDFAYKMEQAGKAGDLESTIRDLPELKRRYLAAAEVLESEVSRFANRRSE